MKLPKPRVNYCAFQLEKLNTPRFSHLKLLLFWPLFSLTFTFLERFYPVHRYYPVHCFLDDLIPFCEWFFIPYLFWFVYLAGTLTFFLFYDPAAFRRMMHFIILTYTAALAVYLLFPTCQYLRPLSLPRDNVLTRGVLWFYRLDTNTNVCPSIHVIGSLAAMFALRNTKLIRKHRGWQLLSDLTAVSICASTVFLKQHSAVDVMAALPLCAAGYRLCYHRRRLLPSTARQAAGIS